ncbi:MAG: Dabb family protein [Clostridiaceae bacterium]|nr:Dabb family protein [Eubacteriales bacterium]
MVKHIVCHKYTDKAEAEKIAGMLMGLMGKVPSLRSMQAGADFLNSARAYHLGLVAEFEDRAGLEAYQNHPAHVKVKEYIHTVLADSVSVDFEL